MRRGSSKKGSDQRESRSGSPSSGSGLSPAPPVVITGICGRMGKRLTRYLHRERKVVGIDPRPFPDRPKDVDHLQVDLRRKKVADVFRTGEVAAVIHMGVIHDPRSAAAEHHASNVAGFQKLLEYISLYNIPKLVVLSSSAVYGPRPDNPQFLTEDAPLLGSARFSDIRDLIEIDMIAQSFFWKQPSTNTVILRPTHILGAVKNGSSNYLRLQRIPTLFGFDPMVQVIHQDDLIQAVALALTPGTRGVFNLAGPPPLPLSKLISLTGRPRVSVPHPIAELVVQRLWKLGMTSFPAPELDHIRYVCMVDDKRARDVLGFTPKHDAKAAVDAVLEGE